jgi:formate dehydrogenase
MLRKDEWDGDLLGELAQAMRDASICGLGQAAPNAFVTAMAFFSDEPDTQNSPGRPAKY